MPAIRFDKYYRYNDLTEILQFYASNHPNLLRLQSLGKSFEGRDIWLVRVTNFAVGPDTDKPAFWVDGNIHAAELAGSSACLMLLHTLVMKYGSDPDITRCLDSRAFYICPRVNPDGAEWALADTPKLIRSSTRPYPYNEEPSGGLVVEDVDGDGRVLTMRIPDPAGPWKICPDEPRLLVPREPAETGGNYYRLLPEGRLEDFDGALIHLQPKKEQLDLNRNFPGRWREEHEQRGAGPYPVSEPEVRAIVHFITEHANICGGVAFHCYSGVLLRPFSYQADEEFPPEDLWTYQKIGKEGTKLTGYPAVSVFHEFRYHPKQVITGALDDWMYEHLGVFAWTVEIWSPQRQAGIKDYKYIDWYREHPLEDDLKMLRWSDEILNRQGYIDWYEFDHQQLGKEELGGWNALYTYWNPPPALLEKEIAPFPKWLVWQNLISPCLELYDATVTILGEDTFHIQFVVCNTGWLPTYITKNAQEKKLTRPVVCEIELPPGVVLESGVKRVELTQLEGRAYKLSAFGWAGLASDPTEDRARMEWVVRGTTGSKVKVFAWHPRAGVVRTELELKG